jgi:tRNA-specific 2-thiouridylase
MTWVDHPVTGPVLAQSSAHGAAVDAEYDGEASLHFTEPLRRIAPGQSVVLYRDDEVLGGGIVA